MRPGRVLAAAMAALVMVGTAVAPAWAADDYLVVSDPEPHAELDRAPGWVTLVFRNQSSATYAAIVVHNSAGENVATGGLVVEGTNVTTQLISGLPKGTYTVIYRTEDESGEPRGGAYQFSYGPGEWTDVTEVWVGEEEQPPEIESPGPPAEPSPTPTTSEPTTSAPVESPTTSPTGASPTPSPSESPIAPPADTTNPTGWIVGIGAGVVVVILGGLLIARGRRGGGGDHQA